MKRLKWYNPACLTMLLPTLVGAAELKVGQKAPSFALKGSDGRTYSLQQYAGKKAVVVAWFPKAFTRG